MCVTWVILAVQLLHWDLRYYIYVLINQQQHMRWSSVSCLVSRPMTGTPNCCHPVSTFRTTRKIPQACKCENRIISFQHKTVVASSHCSMWRAFSRQHSAWIRHATLSSLLTTIFIRNSLHLLEHRVVYSDPFLNRKRILFRSVMSRYWNIFYRVINFKP